MWSSAQDWRQISYQKANRRDVAIAGSYLEMAFRYQRVFCQLPPQANTKDYSFQDKLSSQPLEGTNVSYKSEDLFPCPPSAWATLTHLNSSDVGFPPPMSMVPLLAPTWGWPLVWELGTLLTGHDTRLSPAKWTSGTFQWQFHLLFRKVITFHWE